MGAAHATVINQSTRPLCVITFNMAELIYKSYNTLYIIMPGESQVVEANPDPIGLKVAVVYDTLHETQELLFHRFSCKNDSVLTITMIQGTDVDYYGEGTNLQAKGKLREYEVEPFNMAAETLNRDLATARAPTGIEQAALAATNQVKTILKKVKDSTESALEGAVAKVAGREALDGSSRHSFLSPANIPPPSPTASFEDVSQLTEDSFGNVGGWNRSGSRLPQSSSHLSLPAFASSTPTPGNGPGPSGTAAAQLNGFGSNSTSSFGAFSAKPPGAYPAVKPATASSAVKSAPPQWGSAAQPSAGSGPSYAAAGSAASRIFNNPVPTPPPAGAIRRQNSLSSTNGAAPTASGAGGGSSVSISSTLLSTPTKSTALPAQPQASPPLSFQQQQQQQQQQSSRSGGVSDTGGGLRQEIGIYTSSISAEEKFAQELERKKKEQRWEEEVQRIRREREEAALHPPPPPPQELLEAPVVGSGGCHACVVS